MGRRMQRRDGLAVSAARAGDEVVDRERRDLGGNRLARREVPPEVPRQRGEVRDVGLPAPRGAARAGRPLARERHVAELARHVVPAPQHFAVHDDAHAEAVRHGEEDEVGAAAGLAAHAPRLGDGAGPPGVLDVHREARWPFASRSRSGKSRHPSLGANEMLAPSRSTMPGTTRPMPSHCPSSLWSSMDAPSRAASVLTNRAGSGCVGKLDTPTIGSVSRLVTIVYGLRGTHVDGDHASVCGSRCRGTSASGPWAIPPSRLRTGCPRRSGR